MLYRLKDKKGVGRLMSPYRLNNYVYVNSVTCAVYHDPFWCIPFFRNIPHVHLHEKRENKTHWHGAEIEVIIEGNWTTHRVSSMFWNI
jgi:DNA topoisomerase VI subunit B